MTLKMNIEDIILCHLNQFELCVSQKPDVSLDWEQKSSSRQFLTVFQPQGKKNIDHCVVKPSATPSQKCSSTEFVINRTIFNQTFENCELNFKIKCKRALFLHDRYSSSALI